MKQHVHLEDIPYCPDSCELFARIRELPGAAFLDSSFPHTRAGRYDILTAAPAEVPLPDLPPRAGEQQARQFLKELDLFHREYFGSIQPVCARYPFLRRYVGVSGL